MAVCDRDSANTLISVEELQFRADYLERLTEDLDILFVCLPNDIAAEASSAGLHVFCEKPPGRTLADIVSVMDVERQHPDQRLMYGFNHRYHESVEDALAMMKPGEAGDLISLRGIYVSRNSSPSINLDGGRSGRLPAEAYCSTKGSTWWTSCGFLPVNSPRFTVSYRTRARHAELVCLGDFGRWALLR